jgi:hypothetical protein
MAPLQKIPVRTGIPSILVLARAIVRLAASWDAVIKQVLSTEAYALYKALIDAATAFVADVQPPISGDPLP